jgi:type I restriction enzyme S subunit
VQHRAKARAIIPALFFDTFGDPATNPKGWPLVTIGGLLESASYGTSQKANDRGEGVPMLRMGNVTYGGSLDTSDLKHVEIGGGEYEKAVVRTGDLLFNRTNSKELVGKPVCGTVVSLLLLHHTSSVSGSRATSAIRPIFGPS